MPQPFPDVHALVRLSRVGQLVGDDLIASSYAPDWEGLLSQCFGLPTDLSMGIGR